MRSAVERTRPLTDYANDSVSRLHSYSKRLSQRVVAIASEVDAFMQEYQDALEVHRRTLHKQIVRAAETKQQAILEEQQQLQRRSADAKIAIQFADELLADGINVTEALQFAGILLRRFEHCQQSAGHDSLRTADSLTFLPEVQAPTTKEQHNIPMYGIITTQTAVPKFCTIFNDDGLQFLRVHRKVELLMKARDCDERPLCHGGLRLDVRLKYRDASARHLTVTVSQNHNHSRSFILLISVFVLRLVIVVMELT